MDPPDIHCFFCLQYWQYWWWYMILLQQQFLRLSSISHCQQHILLLIITQINNTGIVSYLTCGLSRLLMLISSSRYSLIPFCFVEPCPSSGIGLPDDSLSHWNHTNMLGSLLAGMLTGSGHKPISTYLSPTRHTNQFSLGSLIK